MLVYAAITTASGEYKQGVYTYAEYFYNTFCSNTVIRYALNLAPATKDEARKLADTLKEAETDTAIKHNGNMLTMQDCKILADVLEKVARRFDLVQEFRTKNYI